MAAQVIVTCLQLNNSDTRNFTTLLKKFAKQSNNINKARLKAKLENIFVTIQNKKANMY